jgi:hypothetical protein
MGENRTLEIENNYSFSSSLVTGWLSGLFRFRINYKRGSFFRRLIQSSLSRISTHRKGRVSETHLFEHADMLHACPDRDKNKRYLCSCIRKPDAPVRLCDRCAKQLYFYILSLTKCSVNTAFSDEM